MEYLIEIRGKNQPKGSKFLESFRFSDKTEEYVEGFVDALKTVYKKGSIYKTKIK